MSYSVATSRTFIPMDPLALIHIAAFNNSTECYFYLTEEWGISPTMETPAGHNALHFACLGGATEIAAFIIGSDAFDEIRDSQTKCGYLYLAACANSYSIVDLLLKNGINVRLHQEESPITKAIELCSVPVIALLLKNLAYIENNGADTLLMLAIRRHQYDAVPLLLAAGEDPTVVIINNCPYKSALHTACYEGHVATVRCLCDHYGAKSLDPPKQFNGVGAVHWLCFSKSLEIADIMLQHPLNVNRLDEYGRPGPFYCLASSTDPKLVIALVSKLCQYGFNINIGVPFLFTVFQSISPNVEIMQWCLNNGADTSIKPPGFNETIYQRIMNSPYASQLHFPVK